MCAERHRNRAEGINLTPRKQISFIRRMTEIAYFLAENSEGPTKRKDSQVGEAELCFGIVARNNISETEADGLFLKELLYYLCLSWRRGYYYVEKHRY